MKKNKPAKKAAPKTAKKVEKKAVAAKKVTPSKTTSKPAPVKKQEPKKPTPSYNEMMKEIEAYKMTVGQLQAAISELEIKNAKLRKRLNAQKEKEAAAKAETPSNKLMDFVAPQPFKNAVVVPPSFSRTLEHASPVAKPAAVATPPIESVTIPSVVPNKSGRGFHSAVAAPTSPFLKQAKATRF